MNTPNVPSSPSASAAPAAGATSGEGRPASSGPSRPPYQHRPGGPRPSGPGGRPMGGPGGRGRRPMPRRKVCRFCAEKVGDVDYKAIPVLRAFITARGKLLSGRTTGNCARHQRQLTDAIKRAQNIALLPFTGE